MKFKEIQIVKIGTQALFREHDRIDINKINDFGHDVKKLRNEDGIMSILVTSGAISLGRMAQSLTGLDDHIVEARVAASIGQLELMQLYKLSIGEEIAQLLPTHDSIGQGKKREDFKKMMKILIEKGVFPIINYNDPADDYELHHITNFADNDKLTQDIASLMEVDRVIILTNVDGLMNKEGKLISTIGAEEDYGKLKSYCDGKSAKGTGGMISKIEIAEHMTKQGSEVIIANSKYSLSDIVKGRSPRSIFQAL